MKIESVVIIALTICIFMSFYLTFLSFQTVDDTLRKQIMTLAASSLITGVIVFATMTVYLGIKKTISRVEDQLGGIEEAAPHDEDSQGSA